LDSFGSSRALAGAWWSSADPSLQQQVGAPDLRRFAIPVKSVGMQKKIKPDDILEPEDVMRLLRAEVERAGGQMPWANMMGLNRPNLNRILVDPISKNVIKALKLRVVFVRTTHE
jgi:hypothetical protein